MEQIPLWFNPKDKRYYFVGIPICFKCKRDILKSVIIRHYWRKRNSNFRLLCSSCFHKHKSHAEVQEIRGAKIVTKIPKNCKPVYIRPPVLSDGKASETIFSMAEINRDGEETMDNTKFACRGSLDGTEQIGLLPEDVDNKNQVLGDEAVNEFLSWSKSPEAQIVDNSHKKKLIE